MEWCELSDTARCVTAPTRKRERDRERKEKKWCSNEQSISLQMRVTDVEFDPLNMFILWSCLDMFDTIHLFFFFH